MLRLLEVVMLATGAGPAEGAGVKAAGPGHAEGAGPGHTEAWSWPC